MRVSFVPATILPCFDGWGRVRSSDLAVFTVAVETVNTHHRAGFGYLRTNNIDLAVVAFDRLRVA